MDLLIEKELLKYKSHIIDHATLSNILLTLGYIGIKDKVKLLKKKGLIQTLKKGLYVHTSPITNNIFSKEIIANNLLGPSYISLDYALSYHALIPESVYEITSMTTKRTKSFSTEYGLFSFRNIKKDLYSIGLEIQDSPNGNFIIATKEKALCDKVYFTKDIKINSKKDMYDFLENDLRLDFEELEDFEVAIVEKYYELSKSKKINTLLKMLKELVV